MAIIKLGKDRTLTLPEEMYKQLKMEEGDPFSVSVEDGHMIVTSLIEIWSPERKAEFLLNNSCGEKDYRENLAEVVLMGLDPLAIKKEYLSRDEP